MPKFQYHFRTKPEKLQEMLLLRSLGWSYQALADKYECPKLTIRYLARKNDLGGSVTVTVISHSTRTTTSSTYEAAESTSSSGRINPGKTYAEYLKEDEERRKRNHAAATTQRSTSLQGESTVGYTQP